MIIVIEFAKGAGDITKEPIDNLVSALKGELNDFSFDRRSVAISTSMAFTDAAHYVENMFQGHGVDRKQEPQGDKPAVFFVNAP